MPQPRDQAVLVAAATMYYLENRSQAEIARTLGVSRSNVSRILADARRAGIVDIRINNPFGRVPEIEDRLIARYGLRAARVAGRGTPETQLSRVGALGAQWLLENLPSDGAVALSWGASVQAVVDAVSTSAEHGGVEILPLVGGLSSVDSARDGNVLVRLLATKLGARHRRLYAPAVVESVVSRDALMRESAIASVLEAASGAQCAVVGIGQVGAGASAAIIDSMRLDPDERAAFEASGAVGDCCTRFFDLEGKVVDSAVNERVIAVELDALRTIPTVVGVAAGARKAQGTLGALRGGLVDVLITDLDLAEHLLDG
ncbi:sugar-binding transcriptional regulator [Sediminivirga luteola]|uniref:Cro/Cl family transcriptional regulator n=1 Tax=Sediminivirga luteola TaxID=1774748 RepID=A0A8J2TVF4_9MICO|nr:sugar-binding transcriptional regulator [Sediminivirga luteola]MCI2264558.1 sugar-binding transcriptional regulator [Sediminivirga luteola]GGA03392.1 Cro/Cl family transcriptional regulator [Sediminivirga luteola]